MLTPFNKNNQQYQQLLHTIYEEMQMPLFIVDVDAEGEFRYAGLNPAMTALTGLTNDDVVGKRPEEIPNSTPENAATLRASYNRCLQANDAIRYEQQLVIKGETTWWLTQLSPLRDKQGRIYRLVGSSLNITTQKRQEERLRLLESAVVNAGDGVLITEAEPLDEPGPRIVYANAAFVQMTGYTAAEVVGRSPRFLQGAETSRQALDTIRQALVVNQPVKVELINYRKDGTPFWAELNIAPVFGDGGRLTHFTAIQREVTALKQAEEALRTANNRLGTLHQVTHAVAAAKLDLRQIYQEIHAAVARLMPAEVFIIELIDRKTSEAEAVYLADRGGLWPNSRCKLDDSFAGYMVRRGRSLRIDDFSRFPKEEYQFGVAGIPEDTHSGLAVLLRGREQFLGILFVQSYQRAAYSDTDLEMLELLAANVAITLENVQLYEQAQKVAVDEERHRLARDLHDAVTQTLFSASLIAEALPTAWERDPARGRQGLTELRRLNRSALAEMRTLLLELRPASLMEKPLADSLNYLCEAMLQRFKIPFNLTVVGDSLLPPNLQIAVYRITQEALNNIIKHAAAGQVTIRFHCDPEQVALEISDDGSGFDPPAVSPEQLGLGTMRERAEAVGAELTIDSRPGDGTTIRLTWFSGAEA